MIKIFISSTKKDLNDERKYLIELIEKHSDFELTGMESFEEGYPIETCLKRAREADVFILILGNRYGAKDKSSGKSFTQLEYEEFLFTHLAVPNLDRIIRVLWKNEDTIHEDNNENDADQVELDRFKSLVSSRHIRNEFNDISELENLFERYINTIRNIDTSTEYKKLSTADFRFKVTASIASLSDIQTKFKKCPCQLKEMGLCNYEKKNEFVPGGELLEEYNRYLPILIKESKAEFNEENPSFKTVNLEDSRGKLNLWFCNSTWDFFRGTNLAARKDERIRKILHDNQEKYDYDLSKSGFSNNLGFTILVCDQDYQTYYCYRSPEYVATNEGKIQLAVGTQLHAYDPKHKFEDGRPNIESAIYEELQNEAGIAKSDIQEIKLLGRGISKEIGNPEFMFVCKLKAGIPIHKVVDKLLSATREEIPHVSEFDRTKMIGESRNIIPEDYKHLRNIAMNPDLWEPESAVASILFYVDTIGPNCADLK